MAAPLAAKKGNKRKEAQDTVTPKKQKHSKKRKESKSSAEEKREPEAVAEVPAPQEKPQSTTEAEAQAAAEALTDTRLTQATPDDEAPSDAEQPPAVETEKGAKNKEKVLVLSSRGIVYRYRHLMEDVLALLPHSKKDSKLDQGKGDSLGSALNELADLRGCSSCVYFETRKKQDLYLWASKVPNGPSAKFHVSAVHTMTELKLVGNHLKGSRPILSFSPSFDQLPHLQLLKELFTQIFTTPRGHRKSKPFFDHVQSFTFLDNHIWFRNYQVVLPGWEGSEGGKMDKTMLDKMTLVEVGPRFCLNPIRVFSGSFGGPTLFENPHFVSPNLVRASAKASRSKKYNVKVKAKHRRKEHEKTNRLEPDELDGMWKE